MLTMNQNEAVWPRGNRKNPQERHVFMSNHDRRLDGKTGKAVFQVRSNIMCLYTPDWDLSKHCYKHIHSASKLIKQHIVPITRQ